MLPIHEVMQGLAEKRPCFHSEADFKHALACECRGFEARFEVRHTNVGRIDLLLFKDRSIVFLEIKYKPAKGDFTDHGRHWHIPKQGAYPDNAKRFEADLLRLGTIAQHEVPPHQCIAIFLTNNPLYWTSYLCNDKLICGKYKLEWQPYGQTGFQYLAVNVGGRL